MGTHSFFEGETEKALGPLSRFLRAFLHQGEKGSFFSLHLGKQSLALFAKGEEDFLSWQYKSEERKAAHYSLSLRASREGEATLELPFGRLPLAGRSSAFARLRLRSLRGKNFLRHLAALEAVEAVLTEALPDGAGAWREVLEPALARLAEARELLARNAAGEPLSSLGPFRLLRLGRKGVLWNAEANPNVHALLEGVREWREVPDGGLEGDYCGPVPGSPGLLLEAEVVLNENADPLMRLKRLALRDLSLRPQGGKPLLAYYEDWPKAIPRAFGLGEKVVQALERGELEEAARLASLEALEVV